MPKVRDILVHVSVETAERRRKCHRNRKHSIQQGDGCLVIKGGAFNSKRNYCQQCAAEILGRARKRLAEFNGGLRLS